MFFGKILRKASLSEDQVYRHLLVRRWNDDGIPCTFIMLNPSTADAHKDDATVRKCMGFARRWGFGALFVVNLFDFRATSPTDLKKAKTPISRENNRTLLNNCKLTAGLGGKVIAAWGNHGRYMDQNQLVIRRLNDFAIPLYALQVTKENNPMHPLYIPYDTQPFKWA